MPTDPRVTLYRDAAARMLQGQYSLRIPVGTEDELGALGKTLVELGEMIERRFREFRQINHITEQINAGLILDDVLDYIFDAFKSLIPYERIGFSLIDEEKGMVRARWARTEASRIRIPKGYAAPLQGSSLERILETAEPRILNDLEDYLRRHPQSESTTLIVEEGIRSSLTCPLLVMGKPVGFLFFSSMKKDTYRDVHIEIFKQIANHLAIIVEKGRLYQQLVELDHWKNRIMGIVAHDLRNPLGVIKGYAQLLTGTNTLGSLSDQQRDFVLRMNRAAEQMLMLINDLLDVSSVELGKLELHPRRVDLRDQLEEWYDANQVLAQAKKIEMNLDVPQDIGQVVLDPARIGQVINNLITNAVKFSYPETTITLRARRDGKHVEIAVQDQGQGIPEEELSKIFKDFGRTSVRPTGDETSTGLGLAIVKRMVDLHGGRIHVESRVGRGSTFTVRLPVAGPPEDQPASPSTPTRLAT